MRNLAASAGGSASPTDTMFPPGQAIVLKSFGGFRYQSGFRGIDLDGRLICWGDQGTPKANVIPLPVQVKDSVANSNTKCALSIENKVLCWATYPKMTTPTEIAIGKVIQIASSNIASCALTEDHRVLCWSRSAPAKIDEHTELAGATSISVNNSGFCGIMSNRTVRCKSPAFPQPVTDIAGITNAVDLRSGGGFPIQFCALEQGGDLKCFTVASDPTTGPRSWTPATLFASNIKLFDVGGGDGGVCGVRTDNHVLCAGPNDRFQISTSTATVYMQPIDVLTLPVLGIRKSQDGVTCLLTTSGNVQCFGSDQVSLGFDSLNYFDSPLSTA